MSAPSRVLPFKVTVTVSSKELGFAILMLTEFALANVHALKLGLFPSASERPERFMSTLNDGSSSAFTSMELVKRKERRVKMRMLFFIG